MAFSIALSNTICSSSSSALVPKYLYPSSPIFPPRLRLLVRAQSAAESGSSSEQNPADAKAKGKKDAASNVQPAPVTAAATPKRPQKPVYSMKKGQIVRVDKEKYLNSVNYLSVGHPPYYKGLDYIYEDRGEVKLRSVISSTAQQFSKNQNQKWDIQRPLQARYACSCMGWHSNSTSLASYRHADKV